MYRCAVVHRTLYAREVKSSEESEVNQPSTRFGWPTDPTAARHRRCTMALPWSHQRPDGMTWTTAGVDLVKAVDMSMWEAPFLFAKPAAGDKLTSAQLDLFFKFNIFTNQLLDRGLAKGVMAPRRFGLLGAAFDFLFMAQIFLFAIGAIALTAFALGSTGLLEYSRAPWLVAAHLFAYLYVLLHTAFVVGAHLGMMGDATKVEAYNALDATAKATAPKPYHYIMWGEQAAGEGAKGTHPFDAHTWPPLVYLPPTAIPRYQKGYILVDLPGLALLLCGSSYAYLAVWGCYLCAALSDHLLLFGGSFDERLKTVLPVRGINMAQYATWCVIAHLSAPSAASIGSSLAQLGAVGLVGAGVHLAIMFAVGARPSRRPGSDTKKAA